MQWKAFVQLIKSDYFSATGTVATLAAEAAAAFDLQQDEASFDLSQVAAVLVQALGAVLLLTVLASAEAAAGRGGEETSRNRP